MWRKNRSPNNGSKCKGTDLNRNFKHKWSTVGVSRDPCSEIYSGSLMFAFTLNHNFKNLLIYMM